MDDLMFEDDVDEVGSDVEAYCPKCKADTTHVVISKYEDEIRRVQCNPCGDVHSYRKPRGEAEDDMPEPVAARKRAAQKKLTWEEFFAKHSDRHAKPYEFREAYRDNNILTHPKFGTGFVSEVVSDSKLEITFRDGRRILVHNRKDMPGIPLAAEGDGTPTPPPPPTKAGAKAGAAGAAGKKPTTKVAPPAGKDSGKDATRSKESVDATGKGDKPDARPAALPEKTKTGKVEKLVEAKSEPASKPEQGKDGKKPATKPTDKPAEKPADKSADKTSGKAMRPVEKSAAKPAPAKPSGKVAEKPAVKAAAKPAAKPAAKTPAKTAPAKAPSAKKPAKGKK